MGIAEAALQASKRVLSRFLSDTALRELVTYRLWSSQSFSKPLGHNIDVFEETSNLRCLRIVADANQKIVHESNLEAGDLLFVSREDEAPSGVSLKDQIVDAIGRVYKIKGIHHVFDVAVVFHVEGHPR